MPTCAVLMHLHGACDLRIDQIDQLVSSARFQNLAQVAWQSGDCGFFFWGGGGFDLAPPAATRLTLAAWSDEQIKPSRSLHSCDVLREVSLASEENADLDDLPPACVAT